MVVIARKDKETEWFEFGPSLTSLAVSSILRTDVSKQQSKYSVVLDTRITIYLCCEREYDQMECRVTR